MADYSFDTHVSGSLASNVAADVDANVTLGGLNDINVDSTLKSDSKVSTDSKVATDSKVKTDSAVSTDSKVATTSNVDLAPVAVDSCVRVELGSLPPTQFSTPWEQRFGLTILGIEWFAWTMSGRTATTMLPVTPEPVVVGLLEHGHLDHHEHDGDRHHEHDDDDHHGLHITLG